MEDIATELGVPVEVLLHGLPHRLRHASDGVILRRFARLGSRADFLRVRDPEQSEDVLRPLQATPRVRAHIMPYTPLWDAAAIYISLREEEGGPSTPYHRQVVITNPDLLFAKYTAYRNIIEQSDLLDTLSESVEAVLTVRLQSQFETCAADQWLALANLREHAWRLVLNYLQEGNILEAKQYLGACFPHISRMIDDNPALAHQTYEYLLTSLEEKFAGEQLDVSMDTRHYLACLASFRLLHLKATNLGFIIALVESLVAGCATKKDYLMGRITLRTLIGASSVMQVQSW